MENGQRNGILQRFMMSKHKLFYSIWFVIVIAYIVASVISFSRDTFIAYVIQLIALVDASCADMEKATSIRDIVVNSSGRKFCRANLLIKTIDECNPYTYISFINVCAVTAIVVVIGFKYSNMQMQIPGMIDNCLVGISIVLNVIHKLIPIMYKVFDFPIYEILERTI